ncbi:MAG TPA: hypothetical protein VHA74_03590 [Candidatus Dojkabacteria bacterium]|nr:hypothetical protein [Candidatus Dojkabacteria bacterium]
MKYLSELENKLPMILSKYLIDQGIEYPISHPVSLTRFTRSEMNIVSKLMIGETFHHINLQHRGIPHDLTNAKYQIGLEIIKSGKSVSYKENILPVLGKNRLIILEQLSIEHSIPVFDVKCFKNLVLDNPKGILESLYSKYNHVLGLSLEDIKGMNCFVREFKVLKKIELS